MNRKQYVYTVWVDGKVYLTHLHSEKTAVYKATKIRDSKPTSVVKLTRKQEAHTLSSTLYGAGYGITPSAKAKARGTAYVPFNSGVRGSY